MFFHYLKLAWRNLLKGRMYSAINIGGLAVGLSFALLIGAYCWGEWHINRDLKNADNQYILQSDWKNPNIGYYLTSIGPLAKTLHERYPQLVKNYYRWDGVTSVVAIGEKSFREGLQIGDSSFLEMYGFKLLSGNAATAFGAPYSVVITAEKAIKFFGRTNVLGEHLNIQSFSGTKHDFTITGVLANPFENSVTHITPDNNNQVYLATKDLGYFGRNMDWPNPYIVSYIELMPGVSPAALEKPIQQLVKDYAPPDLAANLRAYTVPLKEYYLQTSGVRKMLVTVSAIAFFILLMAGINFVNMTVGRSLGRLREIGVRKVMGGFRSQLLLQFLSESVLTALCAGTISLLLFGIFKEPFGNLLGKPLPSLNQFSAALLAAPLLLSILTGLLAGIYPALVLSGFSATNSLKNKIGNGATKNWMSKALMSVQFSIALVAFICAMIIRNQVDLFFTKDPGFKKEMLVSAQVPRDWSPAGVRKTEAIRREFLSLKEVANATLAYEIPAEGGSSGSAGMYLPGTDSSKASVAQLYSCDEYFADVLGMQVKAGRFFTAPGTSMTDSNTVVINELQARALGWKTNEEAVGQPVWFTNSTRRFKIAGVVADFNFDSFQKPKQPAVFMHVGNFPLFRYLSFRMRAGSTSENIAALQKRWSQLLPGTPFDFVFVDDNLARLYASEIQLKKAAYGGTVLAMLIVLSGLVGVVSISLYRRTREIGIRKVLGASLRGIVGLFVSDLLRIVAISLLIACPLAALLMQQWLRDYTFKTTITPLPFVLAGIGMLTIAGILVVLQTMRTAMRNPVNSLRE
jgi:ABC-type antimicrobial peptide transport system permease subunit